MIYAEDNIFCSYYCLCACVDAEAQETVQNPFYVGGFIVIATVACAIVILFGCASFCPRRTNFKVIV